MDKEAVIDRIIEICKQIARKPITRSDLAYELRGLGIGQDSDDISALIWEAYKKVPKNLADKIRSSVINNSRTLMVVDEYKTYALLLNGNYHEVMKALQDKLRGDLANIQQTEVKANAETTVTLSRDFRSNITAYVTGIKGALDIRDTGKVLIDQYSEMVNTYQEATVSVEDTITDFVDIRSEINRQYQKLTFQLLSVFGDSLKYIDPMLFDYENIEFHDTKGMFDNVKLQYDSLAEHCSFLIDDISEKFQETSTKAAKLYKSAGGKYGGLAIAGMSMVLHYMEVSKKTNRLKADLEAMKTIIQKDSATIKGDLGRLLVIYKTLNDIYVPKANAFWKYSETLCSEDMEMLLDCVYQYPQTMALKQKVDELFLEKQNLDHKIIDAENSKAHYEEHLKECRRLEGIFRPQYDQARASKPKKPLTLKNMVTLGSAMKDYERDLYDWTLVCEPVIQKYTDLLADIKIDEDELESNEQTINEANKRKEDIGREIDDIHLRIWQSVTIDDETKLKIASHLGDLIRLLRLAREIVESSLDPELMKKVDIGTADVSDVDLPDDVASNIATFVDTLSKHSDKFLVKDTTKDKAIIGTEAIHGGIALIESALKLGALRNRHELTRQEFDNRLAKLQEDYKGLVSTVDDKSRYMLEVLTKINTATDNRSLKDALMLLSDNNVEITEQDIIDLLNGDKQIEI